MQTKMNYSGVLHHVIVRGIEGKWIFKKEYDKKKLHVKKERMRQS